MAGTPWAASAINSDRHSSPRKVYTDTLLRATGFYRSFYRIRQILHGAIAALQQEIRNTPETEDTVCTVR